MAEYHAENNFCGLPLSLSDKQSSRFTVLPLPFEATTTYRGGTKFGPNAIINASTHMELYDEELQQETCQQKIHTLPPLTTNLTDPAKMYDYISSTVTKLIDPNKILFTLGGEHSISPGLVKAHHNVFPNLSVLFLDAHADQRKEYEGSKHNHACAARRISEICPIVETGIRSLSLEEAEFIKETDKKIFWGKTALNKKNEILNLLSDNVYISLDIDVMDPSVMPATGTPEPDGWLWQELTNFIKDIILSKKIVGIDIVELSPLPDNPAPDFTAAKLIYRLMGYMTKSKYCVQ